jgi:protein-S-isoprenylcysteine O-methyltransferase Ste14
MSSGIALRAAGFVLLVPAAVGGWIPFLIAGSAEPARAWTAGRVLGLLLVVLGWSILLWCTFEFVQRGRGTPSPQSAPTQLVSSGLFRFVRNPMYVGVVTAIGGIALAKHSWGAAIYGAAVALAFHLRVVLYEEPRLTREFGASFDEYRRRVPRWLPRFSRRRQR